MASLNIDISHISPFNIDRSFQSPWERSPYISPKVLTFRTEKDKQNQGLMAHHQAGVGIDDLPPAITFTAPQMLGSNKQRISPTTKYIKSALIVTKKRWVLFLLQKKEKEQTQMKFKNKNHQALFNTAATKLNRHDKTKMALLYLLTADIRLWNMAKHHVKKGYIDLDSIDLGNKGYPKAYTLLGVAKDIANGTSYLSINDLADPDVITPKMYGIIITAIGINRNGITSRKNSEKENENA